MKSSYRKTARRKNNAVPKTKRKPIATIVFWSVIIVVSTVQCLIMIFSHRSLSSTEGAPEQGLQEFLGSGPKKAAGPRISAKDLETAAMTYVRSFEKLDRPLIFFHIPKTAGTAIEYAAGENKIPWGSCLFKHKPKRDICHYLEGEEWPKRVGWWHLPRFAFPLANIDPYAGSELFGVTRDPYERMLSEYNYICTLKVLEWRPNQCDRDRLFDKDYMNEWLSQKLRENERGTALGYLTDNGHFTPQFDFVVGPNDVRVLDYVLSLDDSLSTDFEKLMEAFGLPEVRLKKLNALGAADRDEDKNLNTEHLRQGAVEWIHDLYSKDFGFGYTKREDPELPAQAR